MTLTRLLESRVGSTVAHSAAFVGLVGIMAIALVLLAWDELTAPEPTLKRNP